MARRAGRWTASAASRRASSTTCCLSSRRTCVLARRWRHLWRSAPGIRITGVKGWRSADKFIDFLDGLMDARCGGAPLESLEIDIVERDFDFGNSFLLDGRLNPWIWFAVLRKTRVLRMSFHMKSLTLPDLSLFSQHLTRLELEVVDIYDNSFLDFSGCPALVDLKMEYCFISADKLSSTSLKQLSMTECDFGSDNRTRISLPSLISLELTFDSGRTPLLESMPSLAMAKISLHLDCEDHCVEAGSSECQNDSCNGCRHYYGSGDNRTSCLLLKGLSEATHLELSSYGDVFVFTRDLKWCPKFSKLKILVLNEWCIAADLNALICFLQHSPILEKLILQLSKVSKYPIETEGSCKPVKQSLVSTHLKVVIKCEVVDWRVHKILNILSVYGIPWEHIKIQQNNASSGSGYVNFVCTGFSCN